jgi:sulfite reductase (NADPH) hemoprotein beta-component
MYRYDHYDLAIIRERAAQFRDQVDRRLAGDITENEFKPLRLQNGLYMQLHAYMLRVAIPYGLLSSVQLRTLATITRKYDRGYAHFSTRQNVQLNWPKLEDVPAILEELAEVEMHAVQSSGNCIRNTTSDHFAGVARDEIADPRPWCELIRQWSTFHPEFAFLPRKFKIAVTGALRDRAATAVHDIGIKMVQNPAGEVGFEVWVGGGLGRTPRLAQVVRPFLRQHHLLSYLDAILRVYNEHGRRDNKYKARIKILVGALGIDEFRRQVEAEWAELRDGPSTLTDEEIDRVRGFFDPPPYESLPEAPIAHKTLSPNRAFAQWVRSNVREHRVPGYCSVVIALKSADLPPGDATAEQMDAIAIAADEHGFGRIVVTHRQNLVLPDVPVAELESLFHRLNGDGLATPNADRVTDIVACPGLDFCNLANARSIPLAKEIARRFDDWDRVHDLGEITLNISGCINACGHHHVGNIGILGIDKHGEEHYQLMIGGSSSEDASLGTIIGPAFPRAEIVDAIEALLSAYVDLRRSDEESFLDTVRRLGPSPFKERLYV